MFIRYAVSVGIIFHALGVWCQECKFYGQFCSDDYSCCGGCCLKGICRDKYTDCRSDLVDPCKNRYCPENETCFTYQPPGCKGCGDIIECRAVPIPEELKNNRSLTHYHLLNSSNSLGLTFTFLYVCSTIIVIIVSWL